MDEDEWIPIPDDDVVWSEPTQFPLRSHIPRLRCSTPTRWSGTHSSAWCLPMARTLDGAYDVYPTSVSR